MEKNDSMKTYSGIELMLYTMPFTKPQRRILHQDEQVLIDGIHALQQGITEIQERLAFYDSIKDMPNVTLARINPQDWDAKLKSLEMSLKMMKAQRCVVVHALNGNKAKAESWLGKFFAIVNEVEESMYESPMPYHSVGRETDGEWSIKGSNKGNENSYKIFMDERMQTYNRLKDTVDCM
jgi:hypothetical protein